MTTKQYPLVHIGNESYAIDAGIPAEKIKGWFTDGNKIYEEFFMPVLPKDRCIVFATDPSLGLPLIDKSILVQQDDVEELAEKEFPEEFEENDYGEYGDINSDFRVGFVIGYNKANTKLFAREQMEEAIIRGCILGKDRGKDFDVIAKVIIEYLTPKPVAIEVEMGCCNMINEKGECMEPNCLGQQHIIENNHIKAKAIWKESH